MSGWFDNLGRAVRERRERLGLSQKDLARAIGVNPNTLNRWEKGKSRIYRLDDLEKLASLLGWNSLYDLGDALGQGTSGLADLQAKVAELEGRLAALEATPPGRRNTDT